MRGREAQTPTSDWNFPAFAFGKRDRCGRGCGRCLGLPDRAPTQMGVGCRASFCWFRDRCGRSCRRFPELRDRCGRGCRRFPELRNRVSFCWFHEGQYIGFENPARLTCTCDLKKVQAKVELVLNIDLKFYCNASCHELLTCDKSIPFVLAICRTAGVVSTYASTRNVGVYTVP